MMNELPSHQQANIEEFLTELDNLHARIRRWAKSLPPAEYKALATYLYWTKPDLSVPQIADMIGFKPHQKLNEIVDKRYPFPVTCAVCGQSKYVHYNSRKRSKLSDYDMQRLNLLKRDDWKHRREAYIHGTYHRQFVKASGDFFQQLGEIGYYEMHNLVTYPFIHDGVCDECRDRIGNELAEIKALHEHEVERLKRLPYKEYLESDHWKQFRHFVLMCADYRCQLCNRGGMASGITLNVHHRTYENLGDETPRDVVVLCQTCHHNFHETGRLAK